MTTTPYVDEDDADAIISELPSSLRASWDALDDEDKLAWLIKATKKIDALEKSIGYAGHRLDSDQDHAFPRKYLYNPCSPMPWGATAPTVDAYGYAYESTDYPEAVKEACILEALELCKFYADDDAIEREKLQKAGIVSISEGGQFSESYVPGARSIDEGFKSSEAFELISQYLETSSLLI